MVVEREGRSERRVGMLTDVRVLWEEQGGLCWYCCQPVQSREATIDHVLAVAHGGTNEKRNLVAAHARCNVAKGNRRTHRVKTLERLNRLRACARLEPITEAEAFGAEELLSGSRLADPEEGAA